jgi:uncharacterized protein (DUF433 family)
MSVLNKPLSDCIISDPDRLGGEPVFIGTRVPVRSLFIYLRRDLSLEQFLDDFEGVQCEHVQAVLEAAEAEILGHFPRM